jgi:TonB family protein
MSTPEISFHRIELTYYKEGTIENVLIKDIRPVTSIKEENKEYIKVAKNRSSSLAKKIGEEPKIEKKRNAKSKVRNEREAFKEQIILASKDPDDEKANSLEGGIKYDSAYEKYYLGVREKIKSILEERSFAKEGEVYVEFIINRNGFLRDLSLYKSSSANIRNLEVTALESIEQASPFPPFGDEMDEKELLFKLPIRFTCEGAVVF